MKLNKTTEKWLKGRKSTYLRQLENSKLFHRFDIVDGFSVPKILNKAKKLKIRAKSLSFYSNIKATKLQEKLSKTLHVDCDEVTIANGSDELIENVPRMILEPGDKSVVIRPTFFRFEESTVKAGGKIVAVNTNRNQKFIFDDAVINQVIGKTKKAKAKLLWLCSPNNPTGAVIDENSIKRVLNNIPKTTFVVIDKVNNVEKEIKSLFDIATSKSNVLIISSLSKNIALPGIRVGFGIGHKSTIKKIEKFRLPFNISNISKEIAIKALDDFWTNTSLLKQIKKERKRIFQILNGVGDLELIDSSQSSFFILRHRQKKLFNGLLGEKIVTANLNNLPGIKGLGFVRITIKSQKLNNILINKLKNVCLK